MGNITISITGDAALGTKAKAFAVTDADLNRLVAYATLAFATPPTNGNPNPPALTPALALLAWATTFIVATQNNVVAFERTNQAPPPPFVAT